MSANVSYMNFTASASYSFYGTEPESNLKSSSIEFLLRI